MKQKEEKCCGGCCWFKFEDMYGYGTCQKPHGIAEKCGAAASVQICSDDACENFISNKELRHYQAVLLRANRYRRDQNVPSIYKMPNPSELGKAIDFALEYMKVFSKL